MAEGTVHPALCSEVPQWLGTPDAKFHGCSHGTRHVPTGRVRGQCGRTPAQTGEQENVRRGQDPRRVISVGGGWSPGEGCSGTSDGMLPPFPLGVVTHWRVFWNQCLNVTLSSGCSASSQLFLVLMMVARCFSYWLPQLSHSATVCSSVLLVSFLSGACPQALFILSVPFPAIDPPGSSWA